MIKDINHKNSLIIVALERELPQKLLPNWNIVYSGVYLRYQNILEEGIK